MAKKHVAVLMGGFSSERPVSLSSGKACAGALEAQGYRVSRVDVGRDVSEVLARLKPDVAFNALHGPFGEDGTIQGILEYLQIPYTHSGVLASATCMDKIAQKVLVGAAAPELPLVPWLEVDGRAWMDTTARPRILADVAQRLGYPCFVKPANLGSSVGVHKATDEVTLVEGLSDAARYDRRIVVEQGVDAREIEVAVLGNGGPETEASPPGEIGLPEGVWYDYDTKYLTDVASLHIPAALDDALASRMRALAIRAFTVMGCKGLARVDFLLDRRTSTPYLNELNTMPGFTSISI